MDKEFQTSFIPKKPLTEDRVVSDRPVSIVTFLATIVFFATLVAGVGAYGYKVILTKQVKGMSDSLDLAKNAFEPALLADLQVLEKRINASQEILSNHITVSPIFRSLQELTLRSIRFTKFNYTFAKDGGIEIKMSGLSPNYNYITLALQSDLLVKNKYINNPVFSNLNLDEKGNVTFDLAFSVDSSFVKYGSPLSASTGITQ